MTKKLASGLALSLLMAGTAGAIEITPTNDPTALGQALGSGIMVSGVTGNPAQFGTFTNDSGVYGIGSGIVLSTGRVKSYADGPHNQSSLSREFGGPGQADLTALAGGDTYDAASLTFSFVASHPQLTFNFVFGSEEYPDYVGGNYNDVFGAFIGGPGGTNIAADQFGNRITINSAWMAPQEGTALNGVSALLKTVYDGLTVGETYEFMFGIADVFDGQIDSTVYISSFTGTSDEIPGTSPANPVPLPASALLLGSGLAGLIGSRITRKRS